MEQKWVKNIPSKRPWESRGKKKIRRENKYGDPLGSSLFQNRLIYDVVFTIT